MMHTIIDITNELKGIRQPWAITGGANLLLRNCIEKTNDIDIVTNYAGVCEIVKTINNIGTNVKIKKTISKDRKLKSYYFYFYRKGIKIEVMGDPETNIDGHWMNLDSWHKHIELLLFDICSIPTTSLKYELSINKLIGNIEKELNLNKCFNLSGSVT